MADADIDNLIGGDLSGFSDNINIGFDDIFHKTVIEMDQDGKIDEHNNEADRPIFDGGLDFSCTHPFIFVNYNKRSNEILLTGIFRGPQ